MRFVCTLALLLVFGQAGAALPIPPGISSSNALVKKGFLDVTLYAGVDKTGVADSTAGLQNAIDDGYEYGFAVYFPTGTYLVSDTLQRDQIYNTSACTEKIASGTYGTPNSIRKAPVLVGEKGATRPLIKLKNSSTGFGDVANPKAIVHLRNYGNASFTTWAGYAACGYGLVVRGIDFNVGSSNPGAVGIQIPSAQYSTVEDVTITATGGYAGLRGMPTTNVVVNLDVIGGRYGIIADTCCGITLVGTHLSAQTVASLQVTTLGIVVAAGFKFEPAAGGTAVSIESWTAPSVTLLDGVIQMIGATKPVITNTTTRDVYVANSYVKTSGVVFEKGPSGNPVIGTETWQLIEEYSYNANARYPGSVILINGVTSYTTRLTKQDGVDAPPDSLWTRHSWSQLPWFSDADAKNVLDVDIGAVGNGTADDTDALQNALDTYSKVFLPRGDYRLTRQLVLHQNTQLFGVSGQRSRLFADWDSGGATAYAVKTDTAANATTYLADVAIYARSGSAGSVMGILDWRAGKKSWARQIAAERPWELNQPGADHRNVLHVGASGGGRWYGFADQWGQVRSHANNRMVLVENTSQPLVFYGMNIEHGDGDHLFEMANASNLAIIGTKTEGGRFGGFTNSGNVWLAGLSGHGIPDGVLIFSSTNNALAVNITYYPGAGDIDGATGPMVSDTWNGTTYTSPGAKFASLFRRGTFDWAAIVGWTLLDPPINLRSAPR
jgi:hypothetical protein